MKPSPEFEVRYVKKFFIILF